MTKVSNWLRIDGSSGNGTVGRFDRAGILLLAVLVLAGAIYSAIIPPVARITDEQAYLKLSDNLLHGPGFSLDGVHLTASRPPGYPFFLAAIRALGGGFVSFRIAQFLLLGATIWLVSRLCAGGKPFAELLVATVLVICYPVLFYTAGMLYPQTLAGFLFVLTLWLLLRAPRNITLSTLTGIVFGLLILTVPTFLLTMAVVLAMAWLFQIIHWRDMVVTTLAAAIIVGAWTTRNAVCFDRFVPVASNSGLNLLEGNNENAYALAAANVGMYPYYHEADMRGLDEFQRDAFYRSAAFTWIKAHPGDALILYFEKAANFFNVVNVYSNELHMEVSPWRQAVLAAGYLLLLGLLAWRLAGYRRFPLLPREKLFLAIYVLSAFTSAIFFTRIRQRLPYDYMIIAIVALNLSRRVEELGIPKQSGPDSNRSSL